MAKILITGTSGFIGRRLAPVLSEKHDVVCISRQNKGLAGVTEIQGDFTALEDLKKLDTYEIDALIHLAGVTSLGTEEEQLRVNVLGTKCLMKYLLNRGCNKFVLASSIAAVGLQSKLFCPLELPMPDEHPCLDRHGYGFSKYMMEELARFVVRQNDKVDIAAIRLGVVVDGAPDWKPVNAALSPSSLEDWAMVNLAPLALNDAIRCLSIAAEAQHKPGIRIMNAVGPQAYAKDSVPSIIRSWYGDNVAELDMSRYDQTGHERDPVFAIAKIKQELGFLPEINLLV